jgi:peptide-methionine (S)-S-oxide reductase
MRRPLVRALLALAVALPALAFVARDPSLRAPGAPGVTTPRPLVDAPRVARTETAVLAGGCVWGVEAVFEHVRGVSDVVSGYAGGTAATAEYETVSAGRTRHAESVKVTYDPSQVTYGELLRVFFSVVHDPTQVNRQGPDVGPQYRSAIFYVSEDQRRIATAYIAQMEREGTFKKRIATKVAPLEGFYVAETYHQDFAARNPEYPYIVVHDRPKVEALKARFPEFYRERPTS